MKYAFYAIVFFFTLAAVFSCYGKDRHSNACHCLGVASIVMWFGQLAIWVNSGCPTH